MGRQSDSEGSATDVTASAAQPGSPPYGPSFSSASPRISSGMPKGIRMMRSRPLVGVVDSAGIHALALLRRTTVLVDGSGLLQFSPLHSFGSSESSRRSRWFGHR